MTDQVLTVPAPWGLPILLGLQTTWQVEQPAAVGSRLTVRHGPSLDDFAKVVAWCEANQPPARHLMDLVPWNLLLPGPALGEVRVAACEPPLPGRQAYLLRLADPRPIWAAPPAPHPHRADPGALPPAPASCPVGASPGPLFGRQP